MGKYIKSNVFTSLVIALLMLSNTGCEDDNKVEISSEKKLLSFSFLKAKNSVLVADVNGVIDEATHTVTLSIPQVGADVSQLVATFETTDYTSIAIGYTPQESGQTFNDFNDPVEYEITALDGSKQIYTVNVSTLPNDEAQIKTLILKKEFNSDIENDYTGVINETAGTIDFILPDGSQKAALKMSFTLSSKAKLYIGDKQQENNLTINDFTDPITYTVKAEDGIHTKDYMVTVKIANFKSHVITSLADIDNFVVGDSIKNLTIKGTVIDDAALWKLGTIIGDKKIVGTLRLENTSMQSAGGFLDVVNWTGGIELINNAKFWNGAVFTKFTKIGGDFVVEGCPDLSFGNYDGSSGWKYKDGTINIQRIEGTLRIVSQRIRQDIFKSLKYVGGDFNFEQGSWDFWNWDPMQLEYIGGDLILKDNAVLSNFNGLQTVTYVGGNITITHNAYEDSGNQWDGNRWRLINRWVRDGVVKSTAVITVTDHEDKPLDLSPFGY